MFDKKKYMKDWYTKNKEDRARYNSVWYKNNKDKRKKYKEDNKGKISQWGKEYRIKNPHRVWSTMSLHSHRYRGYLVNITTEELENLSKETTHCPYCGIELSWVGNKKLKFNSPTLDRINNEKELRLDNVEIICYKCNTTKGDRTKEHFLDFCRLIVKRFGEKK
jgi:5-methylcytosine-specific restriction endonuclease McrA